MTEERTNEQAIVQQESGPDQLIVTTFFSGKAPRELFSHWTQPALLKTWWPQEAALDPRQGGEYHLSWPGMDWNLRGTYTTYQPDTHLAFTWSWSHEPDVPTRHVDIRFEPVGDIGTQLTVTHGTYTDSPQDQEKRQGHLEGWTYFLTRLHTALS